MSVIQYSSAIGSLIYAMIYARPDIAYSMGLVSRYQSNQGLAYWRAVKKILQHVKGTTHYSLCYQEEDLYSLGNTNADWVDDLDENIGICMLAE